MKYVHENVAWAAQLEKEFEEYIYACMESVDSEDADPNFETVSGVSYCGCSTCYNREVITFLMPRIIDAYKQGIITDDD